MVAIKIQSLEDIIGAFLENLGFCGSEKQKTLAFLAAEYEKAGKPELSQFIKKFVSSRVNRIYTMPDWDDSQKAALFKYVFLSQNLAGKYGYSFFANEQPDEKLLKIMLDNVIEAVPPCHYSEMPRQIIVSPEPGKLLNKVLHIKRD